ncbi:Fc.00g032310.m01.CDS01 [Cosmosporella sp. VM-42]
MASPSPDAPPSDSKSRDSVLEKDEKPELNGHAAPIDSKVESESLKLNGTGKEDHPVNGNGVTDDVEMENSEVSKPASPKQESDIKTLVTQESSIKSEDVEMSDATPANGVKPEEDKPTEPESPLSELKDSDMIDKPTELVESAEEPKPAEKVNGTTEVPPSSDPLPTSESDLQPASLSQLAIETEPNTKLSIEVAMEDAPAVGSAPSVKIAREREDDATEEPAPKRARTEPREEGPAIAVPTSSSAPAEAPTTEQDSPLDSLPKWNDTEFNSQEITPYQRREIRKVLARVKKTKGGGHFRDSVQKLWPGLWDSYLAKIEKPTDLSEIDRTLRDPNGPFRTISDFRQDLALIFLNTLAFNGPSHDVTNAAQGTIRAIWDDVLTIPQEEPVKPKPVPKQKPPRESRAAAHPEPVKKQATPGAPAPVSAPKAAPPQESVDVRRASAVTDADRPKRTVRAPKPKDIDYSTKPSRKKLKPELQFCEEVLTELMHPRNKHLNSWFMDPVDAEGLAIPQYYSIIKKPMDLGKVSRMLANGEISSAKEFDKIVRLIFTNCYTFNGTPDQGNAVSYVAQQLQDFYVAQMKGKDAWLAKHAKANAPPPASDISDEEDDEEAEAEDAAVPVVQSKEVKDLETKLREESQKLTDLFEADSPNQALIMVQQGILTMVQQALLDAKQKFAEQRQKHEKPKKASKPKPKSSGSRKPAPAHPRKSGGTKKAPVKKVLSPADKDLIATAINDLDGLDLDRAIEIIKRDTGQNENNNGELELDIDQLSNEALLKLWELCKKALPGFGKESAPAQVSSPEISRAAPTKQPKTAAKPKKNKPMSAREQEERIAQLRGLQQMYRPGQDDGQGGMGIPTRTGSESSDDSDSEEE